MKHKPRLKGIEDSLIVNPDGEILLLVNKENNKHNKVKEMLLTFTEVKDENAGIYGLTNRSLYNARKDGIDTDEIISFLKDSAPELSQGLEHKIDDVMSRYGTITLKQVEEKLVLSTTDPNIFSQLMVIGRDMLQSIEGGGIIVRQTKCKSLMERIEKNLGFPVTDYVGEERYDYITLRSAVNMYDIPLEIIKELFKDIITNKADIYHKAVSRFQISKGVKEFEMEVIRKIDKYSGFIPVGYRDFLETRYKRGIRSRLYIHDHKLNPLTHLHALLFLDNIETIPKLKSEKNPLLKYESILKPKTKISEEMELELMKILGFNYQRLISLANEWTIPREIIKDNFQENIAKIGKQDYVLIDSSVSSFKEAYKEKITQLLRQYGNKIPKSRRELISSLQGHSYLVESEETLYDRYIIEKEHLSALKLLEYIATHDLLKEKGNIDMLAYLSRVLGPIFDLKIEEHFEIAKLYGYEYIKLQEAIEKAGEKEYYIGENPYFEIIKIKKTGKHSIKYIHFTTEKDLREKIDRYKADIKKLTTTLSEMGDEAYKLIKPKYLRFLVLYHVKGMSYRQLGDEFFIHPRNFDDINQKAISLLKEAVIYNKENGK